MTSTLDWAGAVGDIWAREWRRTDRSFAGLSPHLDAAIRAAAPTGGGRAVDLGCGAGQTSLALAAARPDLDVLGADASAELVRIAQERGADLSAFVRFIQADMAVHANQIARGADLLFSRHGVMFFADPEAVFTALHRTAAPTARLVFSCFRSVALNPWAASLVEAVTGAALGIPAGFAPGPFGFADADWVAAMLNRAGWRDIQAEPVAYRYIAGAGSDPVRDATAFLSRIGPVAAAIRAAPEANRPALHDRLAATLAEHRHGSEVAFPAAAWLWSARA